MAKVCIVPWKGEKGVFPTEARSALIVVQLGKRPSVLSTLQQIKGSNPMWAIRAVKKKTPNTYSFWLIFMNTCEYQGCIHRVNPKTPVKAV